MSWKSYTAKHNIFGMSTGNRIKRFIYDYSRTNMLKRLKGYRYKPYTKFLFDFEEYKRFNWLNDDKKFHSGNCLRQFNIRRANRRWKKLSPIQWIKEFK